MDPVTALSAAAAIAQFSSYALTAVRRINQFISTSGELPEVLQSMGSKLSLLKRYGDELEKYYRAPSRDMESTKTISTSLDSILKHCQSTSEMLGEYHLDKTDTSTRRVKKAVRSIINDENIQKANKQLDEDAQFLTLHLVGTLLTPSNTSADPPQSNELWDHLRGRRLDNIPTRRVTNFIGQRRTLAEIQNKFEATNSHLSLSRVVVLCGMGGQGKTQIALNYCISRYPAPYSAVFWIDSSSTASVTRSIAAVVNLLKPESKTLPDKEARCDYLRAVLSSWPESWLIIFDNYDDTSVYDIRTCFPTNSKGHILVTTRNHATRRLGTFVELSEMSEEDAVDLLYNSSDTPRTDTNNVYAKAIVRRLGCLPLAVDQAASYMRELGFSDNLVGFLEHYETHKHVVLQSVPEIWEYSRSLDNIAQQTDRAESVYTTWEMSLNVLKPESDHGIKLLDFLNILACFDGNSISEELFKVFHETVYHVDETPRWLDLFTSDDNETWSSTNYALVLRRLKNLSLITTCSKNDGYWYASIHPLVRDWITIRQHNSKTSETTAVSEYLTGDSTYSTFTTVLGASLCNAFHTSLEAHNITDSRPGVHQCFFDMDDQRRNTLLSHVAVWCADFTKRTGNATFQLNTFRTKQNPNHTHVSELLILHLLGTSQSIEDVIPLSKALRDQANYSDPVTLDAVRFTAGDLRAGMLLESAQLDEALKAAKAEVQRWETSPSPEAQAHHTYSRLTLASVLFWCEKLDEAQAIYEASRKNPLYSQDAAFATFVDLNTCHLLTSSKNTTTESTARGHEMMRPYMSPVESHDNPKIWGPATRAARLTPWMCYLLAQNADAILGPEAGERFMLEMLEIVGHQTGGDSMPTTWIVALHGMSLCARPGHKAEGIAQLEKAFEMQPVLKHRPGITIIVVECLASAYLSSGEHKLGRARAREAIEIMKGQPPLQFHDGGAEMLSQLAQSYFGTGEDESALEMWKLRYDRYKELKGINYGVEIVVASARACLEKVRAAKGNAAEAERCIHMTMGLFKYIVSHRDVLDFDLAESPEKESSLGVGSSHVFTKWEQYLWREVDNIFGYQMVFLQAELAVVKKNGAVDPQAQLENDVAWLAKAFDATDDLAENAERRFLTDFKDFLLFLPKSFALKHAKWAETAARSRLGPEDKIVNRLEDDIKELQLQHEEGGQSSTLPKHEPGKSSLGVPSTKEKWKKMRDRSRESISRIFEAGPERQR